MCVFYFVTDNLFSPFGIYLSFLSKQLCKTIHNNWQLNGSGRNVSLGILKKLITQINLPRPMTSLMFRSFQIIFICYEDVENSI